MEQTKKTELKKELYQKGAYCLIMDSLQNQEINAEFQAIDGGLFNHLRGRIQTEVSRTETNILPSEDLFNKFQAQGKINLGMGGFY